MHPSLQGNVGRSRSNVAPDYLLVQKNEPLYLMKVRFVLIRLMYNLIFNSVIDCISFFLNNQSPVFFALVVH